VEALDRRFAELQKRLRRWCEVRCEEEQCLLEISKVGDEFGANAAWNVFDKRMEVFESLLVKDWLDDVVADVSLGLLAEQLICTGEAGTDSRG